MNVSRLLVAASVVGAFVWLFGDAAFRPNDFTYRDASHFYYPLFEFVQSEWSDGRLPLWDPYANAGTPLLANATASVFYPGKLVFFLPIPFAWAFKCYVFAHVLLAAAAAYLLARRWGSGTEAAGMAAVSYAFCGNVMFQYCNVVFLCGAAWLPVAICVGDQMLARRSVRWAVGLGAVLALMTLAGDPQMAYQAGLLVALRGWLLRTSPAAASRTTSNDAHRSAPSGLSRWLQTRPVLLVIAAAAALLLAAIQVLPTLEFEGRSERRMLSLPSNLYEVPAYMFGASTAEQLSGSTSTGEWYQGLIGKPASSAGLHHRERTQFSVAPWRLLEFLWPNFGGRQIPQDHRWIQVLGREPRIWVPSQYMGLLPLLLATATWRLRKTEARVRWVWWMVLIGIVASFGSFGLGWLARRTLGLLADANSESFPVGDEVGGLYWLLTMLLPGYSSFRYPAKLMVIAAVGLSVLAARGWDQFFAGEAPKLNRRLLIVAATSGLLVAVLLTVSPFWELFFRNKQLGGAFGPFQPQGAWRDLLESLLHACAVSAGLWWLHRRAPSRWTTSAALLLTAIELCIANRSMVHTAPATDTFTPSPVAELIREAERRRDSATAGPPQPFRVFRVEVWTPESWSTTSSEKRIQEVLQWERDTLVPKHNQLVRIESLTPTGTMRLHEYSMFLTPSVRAEDRRFVQPRRALDAWGAKYLIMPRSSKDDDMFQTTLGLRRRWLEPQWRRDRPQGSPEGPDLQPPLEDSSRWLRELEGVEVLYNENHFPRAWIVHRIDAIPPINPRDRRQLMSLMQAMLFPFQDWIDLRSQAIVEDADVAETLAGHRGNLPPARSDNESCRIERSDSDRVEIAAVLQTPGIVVLADTFYPGWKLHVATNGGPASEHKIVRTNRMMRGVLLPAGSHHLVFDYRPDSFYVGAGISGLAWLAFIARLIVGQFQAWQERRS